MTDTPETDAACNAIYSQGVAHIPLVRFMEKLERERDGWREAAYSLAEAIAASWDELHPHAEQLRKFKEMVALQNEKTKELLDNADKHSKMYP